MLPSARYLREKSVICNPWALGQHGVRQS